MLTAFLDMNGYGVYIWPAYLSVLLGLSIQWFLPWSRWRKYLRWQRKNNELYP